MFWQRSIVCILMILSKLHLCRGLNSAKKSNRRALKLNLSSSYPGVTASYINSDDCNVDVKILPSIQAFEGDVLILPFFQPSVDKNSGTTVYKELKNMISSDLDSNLQSTVSSLIDTETFKGEAQTSKVCMLQPSFPYKYIALVGLGMKSEDSNGLNPSSAFDFGSTIASLAKTNRIKSFGVLTPKTFNAELSKHFVVGIYDGLHNDDRYRLVTDDQPKPINKISVALIDCLDEVGTSEMLKMTKFVASGVQFAKDLVNAPPNSKTPLTIAACAQRIASEHGLECKILGEKECKDLGMGSYLGVQQGSIFPPQFIHLTYKPSTSADTKKVVLIGKGLTFDSGGYNLKVGASMIELMKFDMGGCGAVLGTAKAIAQIKPSNVEVHFISAVCENMVSAQAMKPGDILTASNGKTIEVLNTDAEGRLTLADALVYAEKLNVDTIIDLATLTGASIVALGEKLASLFSDDAALAAELLQASKVTNEGLWQMPLEKSYSSQLKSTIANLKNIGGGKGGAVTAALFLKEFVEKTSWAHIDMAGPVWDMKNSKATGYGVRLLIEYLLNTKK